MEFLQRSNVKLVCSSCVNIAGKLKRVILKGFHKASNKGHPQRLEIVIVASFYTVSSLLCLFSYFWDNHSDPSFSRSILILSMLFSNLASVFIFLSFYTRNPRAGPQHPNRFGSSLLGNDCLCQVLWVTEVDFTSFTCRKQNEWRTRSNRFKKWEDMEEHRNGWGQLLLPNFYFG